MRRVLRAFTEDDVFRDWAIRKLFKPFEPTRKLNASRPSYLEGIDLNIFKNLRTKPEFPSCKSLKKVEADSFVIYTPSKELQFESSSAKAFFQSKEIEGELKDIENREALFRFSGLFQSIKSRNGFADCDDELIFSWCNSTFDKPAARASYTISERIYHICAYLMLTKAFDRWTLQDYQFVTNKLVREAKVLFQNLEYYGEDFTGNHYSNNGRAFLWLGAATGNKKVFNLGQLIMESEIPRLFRDGLFVEGSPHYHFLIIRNFIEAYLLIKNFRDDPSVEVIGEVLSEGIAHCRKLALTNKEIPNIGDVSPDCNPSWLISIKDLDFTQLDFGERKEVQDYTSLMGLPTRNPEFESGLVSNEFAALRKGEYSLVIHCNPKGYSSIPGHSHCDTGTYCLSKGDDILIWDRGRWSYQDEEDSKSALHFSILVDGVGPDFRERRVYNSSIIKKMKANILKFSCENSSCFLDIDYRNKISVSRKYSLDKGLKEEIEIKGKGKREVSFSFFASEKATISCSLPLEREESLCFPAYGSSKKCIKYNFCQKVSLPFEFDLEIF